MCEEIYRPWRDQTPPRPKLLAHWLAQSELSRGQEVLRSVEKGDTPNAEDGTGSVPRNLHDTPALLQCRVRNRCRSRVEPVGELRQERAGDDLGPGVPTGLSVTGTLDRVIHPCRHP